MGGVDFGRSGVERMLLRDGGERIAGPSVISPMRWSWETTERATPAPLLQALQPDQFGKTVLELYLGPPAQRALGFAVVGQSMARVARPRR